MLSWFGNRGTVFAARKLTDVRGDRDEFFLAETLSDQVVLHLECSDICCVSIGKCRGFITILVEVLLTGSPVRLLLCVIQNLTRWMAR